MSHAVRTLRIIDVKKIMLNCIKTDFATLGQYKWSSLNVIARKIHALDITIFGKLWLAD